MPIGLWWAGVSSTAGTSNSSRSLITAPSSSTPIGTVGTSNRGDRVAKDEEPVGLYGDRARAPNTRANSSTPCRTPAQIDDRLRRRANAARPREVFGERLAKFGSAARISHAQRLGRRVGQRAAGGGGPFTARGNSATSGEPGIRLCVGTPRTPRGRAGTLFAAGVDHPGARSLPRREPALGDQFRIGLGDGVAGQSEVGGQMCATAAAWCRAPAGPSARRRAGR